MLILHVPQALYSLTLARTYLRRVHACGEGRRHRRKTRALRSRDKEVFASDLFPTPFVLAL